MTNINLPKAYSRYGASMGRRSDPIAGKVHLQKVVLDSGGYDKGGAYWGTGETLWCAEDAEGNQQFFRCDSRESAKAFLKNQFDVSFYR